MSLGQGAVQIRNCKPRMRGFWSDWAVFALAHSPYVHVNIYADGAFWFTPLQEGWMVWSTTAACTRLPLRPRSVCNSLSFSNSSALAEWSLLSAQPAMKSEPCVLFHTHTHTGTARAVLQEKKENEFCCCCCVRARGCALAAPAQGPVRKFMLLWHSEQVFYSACPAGWRVSLFLVYLLLAGQMQAADALLHFGLYIGTCVWSSIKCINGLRQMLPVLIPRVCFFDFPVLAFFFLWFKFNSLALSCALFIAVESENNGRRTPTLERIARAGSDGLIWFVFEMEFDAPLVNKSKAAIKKWIFRNIGRRKKAGSGGRQKLRSASICFT
jgi:hypothetical protein